MPAVRRVHDKIRRLPHTCIFPIGVEPQHHIANQLIFSYDIYVKLSASTLYSEQICMKD